MSNVHIQLLEESTNRCKYLIGNGDLQADYESIIKDQSIQALIEDKNFYFFQDKKHKQIGLVVYMDQVLLLD